MKKICSILFFLTVSLFSDTIKIAVAANVSYAMKDLQQAFHTLHPHTKVDVILGGSGKLTAQIRHGAPYDLFMSANMFYPNKLYHDKFVTTKPRIYAQGSLAMMSVHIQNFSKGLHLLQAQNIEKIALANPKLAPYGAAAVEAMKNAGIYQSLKKKFVYGESISQTVSFTLTAADVGIIAKSALFSPQMKQYKEGVHWSSLEPALYKPIDQGMVLLQRGALNPEVLAFYDFILSDKAKSIFEKYGYILP